MSLLFILWIFDKPCHSLLSLSFDKACNNLVQLVVDNSYLVKVMDKASGVIFVDYSSFNNHSSFERKNGILHDPLAYIAAERLTSDYPNEAGKYVIGALWNIKLTQVSGSTTSAMVKMHSIYIVQIMLL